MINRFLDLLREGGVEGAGPQELADILWLARHVLSDPADRAGHAMGTDRGAAPFPAAGEDTASRADRGDASARAEAALHIRGDGDGDAECLAVPVHVPAEAALPHSLELARALRPLTRKVPSRTAFELDEEPTVARLVDENIVVPVLRPEPSRWLTLTLVVDTGPSMDLWRDEVRELHQGLARLGAFRDIRRWNLSGTDDGQSTELRPHPSRGRPPRHHREIVEPTGDQLIVVLSDTVGAIWRSGAAERLLLDWARRSQVALAHLLPASLWNRGGTAPTPARLHIPQPGAPNARWKVALPRRAGSSRHSPVPVPVVELEPGPLRDWARMTAGAGGWTWTSALLLPSRPAVRRTGDAQSPRGEPSSQGRPATAEEVIRRFRLSSSPKSWELAGLLSALPAVTLPVARLVQQAMLSDSDRGELAEVFLGGLLRRVGGEADDGYGEPHFAFAGEVREALLNAQYSKDVRRVRALVDEVSAYLEPRYGAAREFGATLNGVAGAARGTVPYVGEAFATPSPDAVRRLGQEPDPSPPITGPGGTEADETAGAEESDPLFISHAEADRAWAEWVAAQLQDAGYEVELDVWHWRSGDDMVVRLSDVLERCRVVALFSAAYFEPGRWTEIEWRAVLAAPGRDKLVALRIEDVEPPEVVRPLTAPALFGLGEEETRQALLEAVKRPARPEESRPGAAGPQGSRPWVRYVPRTPRGAFVGREELLAELSTLLADARSRAVVALHGPAGVGKTLIAREYTRRHARHYDVVWWVSADDPALIPARLAMLGVRMGVAERQTPEREAVQAVLAELRSRDRWLIVFDGSESPEQLAAHLPSGPGHILITSRDPHGDALAVPVAVDVFARAETVAVLRSRLPALSPDEAEQLAEAIGDVPVAVAVTAEFLRDTAMPVSLYLAAADLSSPSPTAAVGLALLRLRAEAPEAADLVDACALLAPEPLPLAGFPPISRSAREKLLAAVQGHGLAKVADGGIQLHRLTLPMVRERLSGAARERAAAYASSLLEAAAPGDGSDPDTWPRWAQLLPHLLAVAPDDLTTSGARRAACEACRYLKRLGDTEAAVSRLQVLHATWREWLGRDHPDTLVAAVAVAEALADSGQPEEAVALTEEILAQQRVALGEDHPDTLGTACNLAILLSTVGRVSEAVLLDEDALVRRRRVLGEDHPSTLVTAGNLAVHLARTGRYGEALELHEETLARSRRVLGDDHHSALAAASNMARLLVDAGRPNEALALDQDTFARRSRLLGEGHPDTLRTAVNLVTLLSDVGRADEARELAERTLDRQREVLGEDHPETLRTARYLQGTRRRSSQ